MEANTSTQKEELIKAYLTLARYADNQYQRIERHMSSPAFEAKKQLLQQSKVCKQLVLITTPSQLCGQLVCVAGSNV